eukprot:6482-Heterococcus_DN1.PRE.2
MACIKHTAKLSVYCVYDCVSHACRGNQSSPLSRARLQLCAAAAVAADAPAYCIACSLLKKAS